MFGGIGMQEILVILVIFLLVFGAKRLPELGQAMGKGIREFKRSVSDIEEDLRSERPRASAIEETTSAPGERESKVEIVGDEKEETRAR